MADNLSIGIAVDITDLQTKLALARAEVQALCPRGALDALTDVPDRARNPADNTKLVQTLSGLAESTGSAGVPRLRD